MTLKNKPKITRQSGVNSYRQFIQRSPITGGIQPLNVEWNNKTYLFSPLHLTINETHFARKASQPMEHAHDVYHIVIYTEGRNYFRLNGKSCAISPGTLALVSPGEKHNFSATERGKTVYSEITFEFVDSAGQPLQIPFHRLLALYEGIDMPDVNLPARLSAEKTHEAQSILAGIFTRLMMQQPLERLEIARELLTLFSLIIRECYLPQINVRIPEPNPIRKVRDYIESNYAQRLKIKELAGMAGMSTGYFFRAFKKQTGRTPIACQQRLRIQAAQTLLRYSHLRCKEIAGKVGYEDAYYFSKLFKKIAGLSPMVYRRRKIHGPDTQSLTR